MYALSSPLVSIIFKGLPRRYITQIAFIVSSVALFLFGPSKLLGFPESLGIMIGGICLLGVAISLIFVPLLSEIIEAVQEKEGLPENPILNDKASAVFNAAYATGCIIGPILGGCISDATDFGTTCDIMALASCTFGVIYFFINILPNCFSKKKAPVMEEAITQDTSSEVHQSVDLKKPMLDSFNDNSQAKTLAGTAMEDSLRLSNEGHADNSYDGSFTKK